MKKKIVYTAIFGGYDELKPPKTVLENWGYVCFTDDSSMKSDVWDVRLIDRHELGLMGAERTDDPRALGKFFKIKPYLIFPDCDESLWMDGSDLITGDIDKFISKYSQGSDMLCFKHSTRDCIYEEAKAVLALGYAGKGGVDAQIKKYRDDGYPEHNGLIAGGLLYRKHTEKLIRLMDFWYEENMRETLRDQLSFNYCAWKLNFIYNGISDQTYYANDYFKFIPHSSIAILAKIYLKTGRLPFSEGTEVTRNFIVQKSMPFELSFGLEEQNTGFTDLRFDPCEVKSKIKIYSATLTDTDGNSERLDFLWSSGEKENDRYVFDKNHKPMFFYKLKNKDKKIRKVVFTGEIDFQTDETDGGYSDAFFRQRKAISKRSAELVIPVITRLLPEEIKDNFSVIDFGCATGDWLKIWQDHGAVKIAGINDTMQKHDLMEIPEECVIIGDLSKNLNLNSINRFTVCQCLEVAEHLYEDDSKNLLDMLTASSDIIIFSAAIPGQVGTHHVNCQWPSYWIKRFAELGYLVADCVRPFIWDESEINVIYRQNLLIFFKDTPQNQFLKILSNDDRPDRYNLIHPDLWGKKTSKNGETKND